MSERQNETEAIRNLQRYLRQLSLDGTITPSPPIDGIFERDTRDALIAFQRSRDLPATGVADAQTWELLYAAYRSSLAANSPPRTVALFPRTPSGYSIGLGNEGFLVRTLQYMLTELGSDYSDLGNFEINGIYDQPTESAVTAFQSHNVLAQNGRVNQDTWNAITDRYNTLFTRFPVE